MGSRIVAALVLLAFVSTAAWGAESPGLGRSFPQRLKQRESLLEKARRYSRAIETHHLHDGVVTPRVLFPPEGRADNSTGHQEDGCARTGAYLGACALEYAATKELDARRRALDAFRGIMNLERVTGVPGLFARSLKKTPVRTVDEDWFFFPEEWRDSPSMPGYRYLGDVSSDQLSALMFGVSLFHDLVADKKEQRLAADLVDRIYGRIVSSGMRIIDADGKITLWGNFAVDQPHQELNSLLALAHLRIAARLTGRAMYREQYRLLIERYGYLRDAILSSVNEPEKYIVWWDDRMAFMAVYNWLRYEEDPYLRDQIRRALDRYWIRARHTQDPLQVFIYQAAFPGRRAITRAAFKRLLDSNIRPRRYTRLYATRRGPMKLTGTWEESPDHYLLAYWMGRRHGFLDAKERLIATYPKGRVYRRPKDPRPAPPLPALVDYVPDPRTERGTSKGMVRVPAGEFIFGSRHGDFDEVPARRTAVIGRAYYMDRYEVTAEQFARVMGRPVPANPIARRKPAIATWVEADEYARRIGKRLPTEMEWERAARGTDGRTFPWGEAFSWDFVAWDDAEPVGAYPAGVSPAGCHDMAGNVWEWTADWYDAYPGTKTSSPLFGRKRRVARGGAGFNQRAMLRTSYRGAMLPNWRLGNHRIGFRCAMNAGKNKSEDDDGGEEF